MDKNKKRNNPPHAWPYVLAGSVIGGAVGFLFSTDTGQRIRRGVTHPGEMADNIADARAFLEKKTRVASNQMHNVLRKAQYGIEEGQRAYEVVRGAIEKQIPGQLKSVSVGKRVKSRKQANAIGHSHAGKKGAKAPRKKAA